MIINKRFCDFCGTEIEHIETSWPKYVLILADESGKTFGEFDVCNSCFDRIVKNIDDLYKNHGGK